RRDAGVPPQYGIGSAASPPASDWKGRRLRWGPVIGASEDGAPARSRLRRALPPSGRARRASLQLLLEESHRAGPRHRGRLLVIARGVGVVVEGVVHVIVDKELIVHAVFLQRRLEVGDAGVDALVEAGIVQHDR